MVEIQLTSKTDRRIRKLVAELEGVTVQTATSTFNVPLPRDLSFGLAAERVQIAVEAGSYTRATLQVAPAIKAAETAEGLPLSIELRERTLLHDQPFEVRADETTQLVLEVDLSESIEFVADDRAIFSPRARVVQLMLLTGKVEEPLIEVLCFFPLVPPLPTLPAGHTPPPGLPIPSPPVIPKDTTPACERALARTTVVAGAYSLRILPVPISVRGFRGDGSFGDFAETLMPKPPVQIDQPPPDSVLDLSNID
jgi:hypothetical protein